MKGFWAASASLSSCQAWWIQPDAILRPNHRSRSHHFARHLLGAIHSPATRPTAGPTHAKVEVRVAPDGDDGCWYNSCFLASMHVSIAPKDPLTMSFELVQDAQSLVFGHEVAAAGIRRHALDLSDKSGMMYVLRGPVAAPIQFFVTDSTTHFLRGSLYFNHAPNPDSSPLCSSGWKRTFVASWNPFWS